MRHIILSRGKLWEIKRVQRQLLQLKISRQKVPRIANKKYFIFDFKSDFDAQGSYTGVNAENIYDSPVQDADDL